VQPHTSPKKLTPDVDVSVRPPRTGVSTVSRSKQTLPHTTARNPRGVKFFGKAFRGIMRHHNTPKPRVTRTTNNKQARSTGLSALPPWPAPLVFRTPRCPETHTKTPAVGLPLFQWHTAPNPALPCCVVALIAASPRAGVGFGSERAGAGLLKTRNSAGSTKTQHKRERHLSTCVAR